jgi:predicted TIM-barrel fold metal-dependent hydrolase
MAMAKRIDAHIHYKAHEPADTQLVQELDLKLLNICVGADSEGKWRKMQSAIYEPLTRQYPDTYAWVTAFDTPNFKVPDSQYQERCIAEVQRDIEKGGAVGCKIWKGFGMEVKYPDGRWVMPDDEIFEPIYAWLEKNRIPLLAHIAEPMACWRPLEPGKPHYGYYSQNPKWHMYNRPDCPSHETLMKHRDNVVARHPKLPFIGAHLASLEYDLDELAARLDAFPHFVVDTSARMADLLFHDQAKVKAFIEKYQDRILWGTDVGLGYDPTPEKLEKDRQYCREMFVAEIAYFSTDKPLKYGPWEARGLGLSPEVQQKIFVDNARRWYPGL